MEERIKGSVCIRKLSELTKIGDCKDSLCEWIGINPSEKRQIVNKTGCFLKIGDFPYDIWCCRVGSQVGYGKTLNEVLSKIGVFPEERYNQFRIEGA